MVWAKPTFCNFWVEGMGEGLYNGILMMGDGGTLFACASMGQLPLGDAETIGKAFPGNFLGAIKESGHDRNGAAVLTGLLRPFLGQ